MSRRPWWSGRREKIAGVAEFGRRGEGGRAFSRDDDGLIERDGIRRHAVAAASAVDDVPQRPPARVFVCDEWDAVRNVDGLILGERRSGQQRHEVVRLAGGRRQRRAIPAEEPANRHRRSELAVVDPPRAPEIAESVGLKFLEENERTELLVR